MNKVARALAAPLLAAACGTGTDGKPVTPPTTPEPVPTGPPVVRAVAELWSQPDNDGGYSEGDRIRVVLEFDPLTTTVKGSPRLAIEMGDHVRLADFSPWVEDDWPPERPSFLQRFEYRVGSLDEDQDGISIPADALDFSDGAIRGRDGGEIEVAIRAVDPQGRAGNLVRPGEPLDTHRVIASPQPRVCTDERQRALNYGNAILPREWDGTPFRFDLFDHFPEAAGADYPRRQLRVVQELADRIEDQVGYPIIEAGSLIPVPAQLPAGWNVPPSGRSGPRNCAALREPGQIVGIDLASLPDGHDGGGALSASPWCALVSYYVGDGPLDGYHRSWARSAVRHELFHLFGFKHRADEYPAHIGVTMSPELLNGDRDGKNAGYMYVTFEDVDALRCIFPEGE